METQTENIMGTAQMETKAGSREYNENRWLNYDSHLSAYHKNRISYWHPSNKDGTL